MESLRIAEVIGEFAPSLGGQARMVGNVVRAMEKLGHHVEVFSLDSAAPAPNFNATQIRIGAVLKGRLWAKLSAGDFDVIHCHGYSSLIPSFALPGEFVLPATRVLTPHFHTAGGFPPFVRRAYDMTLGALICRASDQIQVDTTFEMDALAAAHRIPPERFEVVPPSLGEPYESALPAASRKFPDEEFHVLFVGRLESYKGADHLMRALASMKSENEGKTVLTIVGRDVNGNRHALEGLANELGLRGVRFLEGVSDERLLTLYDRSSLLALPSRHEAFGIALLEAMSRGVPVVAADSGGMPYLVEAGKNGSLVNYGDVPALAAAIRELMENREKWERFSAAGIATSRAYFSDLIAKRTVGGYRRSLSPT